MSGSTDKFVLRIVMYIYEHPTKITEMVPSRMRNPRHPQPRKHFFLSMLIDADDPSSTKFRSRPSWPFSKLNSALIRAIQ